MIETCISEKLAYGSLLLPIPVAREPRDSGKTLTSTNGWRSVPKPRMMGDYAVLCNVRVKVLKPPLLSELGDVRPRLLLASSATPGNKATAIVVASHQLRCSQRRPILLRNLHLTSKHEPSPDRVDE